MSDTITNLIRIPGVQARVVVDADYHWRDLGALLADGFDGEQAELLDALAKGIRDQSEGKRSGGLMQLQYVADVIHNNPDEYDIDVIRWLLSELLTRLETS